MYLIRFTLCLVDCISIQLKFPCIYCRCKHSIVICGSSHSIYQKITLQHFIAMNKCHWLEDIFEPNIEFHSQTSCRGSITSGIKDKACFSHFHIQTNLVLIGLKLEQICDSPTWFGCIPFIVKRLLLLNLEMLIEFRYHLHHPS